MAYDKGLKIVTEGLIGGADGGRESDSAQLRGLYSNGILGVGFPLSEA